MKRILKRGWIFIKHEELTEEIIGSAYEVFNYMNFGYMESVYEECLLKELTARDLKAESQVPLQVDYKGEKVGEYFADIMVEGVVILELKSVRTLERSHEIQLVSYLTSTGIDVGLLINFGPGGVQIKRKTRTL